MKHLKITSSVSAKTEQGIEDLTGLMLNFDSVITTPNKSVLKSTCFRSEDAYDAKGESLANNPISAQGMVLDSEDVTEAIVNLWAETLVEKGHTVENLLLLNTEWAYDTNEVDGKTVQLIKRFYLTDKAMRKMALDPIYSALVSYFQTANILHEETARGCWFYVNHILDTAENPHLTILKGYGVIIQDKPE